MSLNYAEKTSEQTEVKRKDFNFTYPNTKTRVRITKSEFGKSALKEDGTGGNPMFTFELEVISPEKVKIKVGDNFEERDVQGLKITDRMVITAKALPFVEARCKRFGVDLPDDERPNINEWLGKEADCLLKTQKKAEIDDQTGEPIFSGGEPLVRYYHSVKEYLD